VIVGCTERVHRVKTMYECRCDDRLKTKAEESALLTYTGLKIKTRLIDEKLASVMGECVI